MPEDVALHDRRTEQYAGWRIFLESLAERRPLVVVIDDLQWADDGMLDFVDGLVDLVEGVPLLVVACARPELLERRPGWGGGKRNALTVSLGPLSTEETSRLVESLLGRDPADEQFRGAVVERAAGNPLYAEEFARVQSAGGDVGGLPESVLAIVAARVDLLPPAEKELLRDAAVMGGVVWSDDLRAVSDHDDETVDGLLRSLGRKEFLRRERGSAVLGATEHSFVHTLVRDAVYGQLPRADRVDRHVRVARWIESLPEDRREDRAELLAHHYLEAIELARSAGLDVTDLELKAATALREAGMRASAVGAFPDTVRAPRGAAAWLPEGLDPRAQRALGKALSFTQNTGDDELRLAFDSLVAEGATAEAAVTANDLALVHWRHGDGAGAASWTERALELVAGAGPTHERADVLTSTASAGSSWATSPRRFTLPGTGPRPSRSLRRGSSTLGELAGSTTSPCSSSCWRSSDWPDDQRVDEATAVARRLIGLARERGDDQMIFPTFSGAAWTFARTGSTAEADTVVDELLERRRSNPSGAMPGYWTTLAALALERLGRRGALTMLDEPNGSRFLEAALAIDDGRFAVAAETLAEIGALPLEAEARILAGQPARARELLERLGATARLRELAQSQVVR